MILAVNYGSIVETGTHAELQIPGSFYANRYDNQFTGRELNEATGRAREGAFPGNQSHALHWRLIAMTEDSAAGLITETISIPLGQTRQPMAAYLATPDRLRPHPGVVIIHEIFGLTKSIRETARRFAGEGYVALAVDLFSGSARPLCLMRIFYGMMIRPLKNGVVGDLRQAVDFLQGQPDVDPGRVGVIGFCMGGTYALQLACVEGDLRAASVFYGQNPRPLEAVAQACPIVGSYPEKDFTAGAARTLEQALTRHGVPHDVKIYPGAHHSFFNSSRSAYNPEAADDAWRRTLSFFDVHLRNGEQSL